MSKFNRTTARVATGSGPIRTESTPTGRTHEGAPGFRRDAMSELFLLAVSTMVGEDSFYETAADRDARFTGLIRQVAATDPAWLLAFVGWLRGEANLRSAAVVAAAEAVAARLATPSTVDGPANRAFIGAALQRADEPGELVAYWTSRHGRALPKPVKRGLADAVRRLYNEYALLKYDTAGKGYRFADVVELVHPEPTAPWQGDLFRVALERRHNRAELSVTERLPMLAANRELRRVAEDDPAVLLDPDRLRAAGMTWEDVLSLAGTSGLSESAGSADPATSTVDKVGLWTALIPSMGYMALLRNLRNFDEAGVSDEVAATVAARLADPAQVARSRQFPYRFLAAYEAAPSLRWGHALDQALTASLRNIPALPGRSLVLVDTSASMTSRGMSARSAMTPAKAAAVFGVALAARGQVDLWGFADGVFAHPIRAGASVLREVDRFVKRTGEVGHGTRIAESLRATYAGHDRVFILSDMQTMDSGTDSAVPGNVALYGFNLGGYRHASFRAGTTNRHEFGGLTDATFRMVPLLEAGRTATWPWLS